MSPISPYSDLLYRDLSSSNSSVHLSDFPEYQLRLINLGLEEKMHLVNMVSSLVLSIRKRKNQSKTTSTTLFLLKENL